MGLSIKNTRILDVPPLLPATIHSLPAAAATERGGTVASEVSVAAVPPVGDLGHARVPVPGAPIVTEMAQHVAIVMSDRGLGHALVPRARALPQPIHRARAARLGGEQARIVDPFEGAHRTIDQALG